jgi:hypothetical protein
MVSRGPIGSSSTKEFCAERRGGRGKMIQPSAAAVMQGRRGRGKLLRVVNAEREAGDLAVHAVREARVTLHLRLGRMAASETELWNIFE